MAGKIQRCYKCVPVLGYEFQGDKPECPRCGASFPDVLTLQLVHLMVPAARAPIQGSRSQFYIACQPQRANLRNFPATTEPPVVTCPLCRKSDEWAKMLAVHLDGDDYTLSTREKEAKRLEAASVVVPEIPAATVAATPAVASSPAAVADPASAKPATS